MKAVGVALEVGLNGRHRDLLGGNLAVGDERLAQADVGVAVLGGVVHVDDAIARELQHAGALHHEPEEAQLVVHPGQLQAAALERLPVVDLGAGEVGRQAIAVHPPKQILAGQRGPERAQVDLHQVPGRGVDGELEPRIGGLAGLEHRQVVAGEVHGALRVGAGHGDGLELGAHGRVESWRAPAGRHQRLEALGALAQSLHGDFAARERDAGLFQPGQVGLGAREGLQERGLVRLVGVIGRRGVGRVGQCDGQKGQCGGEKAHNRILPQIQVLARVVHNAV
ncbi:hypothetical protein D3C72_1080220 [compost metagenome]